MEIRPILSALMRSKVSMILIGLQVALTLAIVCNALFIIVERAQLMNRPSGMNEADTFSFGSNGFAEGFDVQATQQADLQLLRQLPGVADVTPTNSSPLSGGGWGTGVMLAAKQKTPTANSTLYFVDSHGINTFGTHLIAGRDFKQEEIQQMDQSSRIVPPVIIVTKALADKLFPDGDAIGKSVFLDEDPPSSTIVGVVDRLQEPWVNDKDIENAVLIPGYIPYGKFTRFLVRTEPGRRDEVMKDVEQKIAASNIGRIIGKMHSTESFRKESYAGDRAMMVILSVGDFLSADDHRARHRRHGKFLGRAAHQADRHAACARCIARRDPALFPDREFPDHDRRADRGRRARVWIEFVAADEYGRRAFAAVVLRADGIRVSVDSGADRGARSGDARGACAAGGGDAERLINATSSRGRVRRSARIRVRCR